MNKPMRTVNQWKCPYCDAEGEKSKWNKPCYRELVEHVQENHLEEAFTELIGRYTPQGKKQLLDGHWGFFTPHITITKEAIDETGEGQ
jgi:hypothetical protein